MKEKQDQILVARVHKKNIDLALGVLFKEGIATVEEKKRRTHLELHAGLPKTFSAQRWIKKLQRYSPSVFYSLKIISWPAHPWIKAYQKYLQPFPLLKENKHSLWIDPTGKIPAKQSPQTLYLKPSLAFGTGTHPTTQLCGELVWQYSPGKKVLDLGCGTGILAMIAAKANALGVHALDNDPIALQMAREHFEINRLPQIESGASLSQVKNKFEVLVANLLLNTFLTLKKNILRVLKKNGILIVSGLLYKDCPVFLEHYEEWICLERKNRKGWSALVLKKKD